MRYGDTSGRKIAACERRFAGNGESVDIRCARRGNEIDSVFRGRKAHQRNDATILERPKVDTRRSSFSDYDGRISLLSLDSERVCWPRGLRAACEIVRGLRTAR